MSNSRLEKFIYAICGMEVDDLPTPLSRIETLWNCLITGETPDFEPLSRNEKYLMAMLNDNVDGLPEPTSRSEKLLYKIATGETDLSDVPGYLSRYEELLKQLIENGGIGGTDFEYVLYTLNDSFSTLYSTAEALVRSAILKGHTLVNLSPFKSLMDVTPSVLSENSVIWYGSVSKEYFNYSMFKPNTKYIVKFGLGTPSRFKGTYISGLNMPNRNGYYTEHNDVFTTPQTIPTEGNLYLKGVDGDVITKEEYSKIEVMIIEYQDGMENWDIPYFTGMQSVKIPVLTTCGKNLFDKTKFLRGYYVNESTGVLMGNGNNALYSLTDFIEIQPNKTLTNNNVQTNTRYAFYDKNKTFINGGIGGQITSPSNARYLRWSFAIDTEESYQIEYGTSKSSYEPYKSNILTTPQDVVLRKVGDVEDTLDCSTGELTQRIGEIVLDGSEDEEWIFWESKVENVTGFYMDNVIDNASNMAQTVLCNSIQSIYVGITGINRENIFISPTKRVNLNISNTKATTVTELRNYLSQNPITVQYRLANPVIKTVVLSTLDQDGQPTKLSTFNDITHVSIEAEDLLPTVDLEVATKIEETLSTLPTLMNDISETQQSLNEKIDAQAENINEVSTAMAEIRSDIL